MAFRRKVLETIIPADGWHALFVTEDSDGVPLMQPLICWAIVRFTEFGDGPERLIVGVVAGSQADIVFVSDTDNFVMYLGPGETLAAWKKEETDHA